MRLRSILSHGFRGLPDGTFDLTDPSTGAAASIVAVVGPSASGKTSFLDAIIACKERVGPYGSRPVTAAVVAQGNETARLGLTVEVSAAERERHGIEAPVAEAEVIFSETSSEDEHVDHGLRSLLSHYTTARTCGRFEYFHAKRSVPTTTGFDAGPDDLLSRQMRLRADDQKFASLAAFAAEEIAFPGASEAGEPSPGQLLETAFAMLCSTKRIDGVYRGGRGRYPKFADSRGRTFGPSQLSSGEHDGFLLAASFVERGLVAGAGSIILIDGLEQFVSEAEAADRLRTLADLGPRNQILVTTRSRVVAAVAARVVELAA